MLAALLLAMWQSALLPEPEKRVDFKPETARMVNLAEPLGEALGVKVAVGENLRNEVLAVFAPNVMRKDLAAKIAECLDADWRRDGTTLVLERSKAREEQMRQREVAWLVPKVRAKQRDLLSQLERTGPFTDAIARVLAERLLEEAKKDPNGAAYARAPDGAPLERFAQAVLTALPPERLAAISPVDRAVFRPRPNRRQVPLVLPTELMRRLRTEQPLFSNALKSVDLAQFDRPWAKTPNDLRGEHLNFDDVDVMVTISGNYLCNIGLFDREGTPVASSYARMEIWESPKAPTGEPAKVDPDPLSDEFVAAYRASRGAKPFKVEGKLREFLLHPDRHDPLALALDAPVRTLARVDGRAIVMRAWDDLFYGGMGVSRGSSRTLGGFRQLLASAHADIVDDGSWRLIRPCRAMSVMAERADRHVVAQWLKSTSEGGPTLDHTLNLFAAHYVSPGPFSLTWFSLLFPDRYDSSMHQVFGQAPALLAALTPAQRKALDMGAQVPVGQLTKQGVHVLEEMVFGLNGSVQLESTSGAREYSPLRREPTEIFPADLPKNGYITGKHFFGDGVFSLVTNVQGHRSRVSRGTKDVGYQIARIETGTRLDPVRWPQNFVVSRSERWSFTVNLLPGVSCSGEFVDRFAPWSEPRSLEALPDAFVSRVKAWADYYKAHPEAPEPPIGADYDDEPPG